MATSTLVSKLEKLKTIRSRQVLCPVAKLRAIVSPLTVSDDLSLKTMISSPDLYDRELAILIYNHTDFPDIKGSKPNFDQFLEAISDFDKKSLLWGIYDATYATLGKNTITCPKCKNKQDTEIFSRDLLHGDSIKSQWDKEESFLDYFFSVDIPITGMEEELTKFEFNIAIPSISKHLEVLKLISVDDMKDNFNKFNSIVSKTEELCLITKNVAVYGPDLEIPEETISNVFEVHALIQNYVTLDVINDVIDAFDKEFGDYNPVFRKEIKCKSCGHGFDFPVDMEVALFRSFLRL